MQLSKETMAGIDGSRVVLPTRQMLALPERVLQFGTGVLLRGLPDYFIDKANREGVFNGRVVVVKSTGTGSADVFAEQDGLYTLLERGMVDGEPTERASINAAISRVLAAGEDWDAVLACAADPNIQIIISNTTEIGITLVEEDAVQAKPVSFPGRILFFLLERYRVFNGSDAAGMVIVPTELIVDNGAKLKQIVLTLANKKGVNEDCIRWIAEKNEFCNSLVDCIVPGKLAEAEHKAMEEKLGYEDELMIMSEPYRLWAIETSSERTRTILSFSQTHTGVVLAPDINKFRELKLRLLNASHTLTCGIAHLSGFTTVKEAMCNELFLSFIEALMHDEIIPLVAQGNISVAEARQFAQQVTDRFKNPYIEHLWLGITVQYTSKMAMRVAPLVERYYAQYATAPRLIAMGFAAFLLFMDSKEDNATYTGTVQGKPYLINDSKAALLHQAWQQHPDSVADVALTDVAVFDADLSQYPGFAAEVTRSLEMLKKDGVANALRSILAKKTVA